MVNPLWWLARIAGFDDVWPLGLFTSGKLRNVPVDANESKEAADGRWIPFPFRTSLSWLAELGRLASSGVGWWSFSNPFSTGLPKVERFATTGVVGVVARSGGETTR